LGKIIVSNLIKDIVTYKNPSTRNLRYLKEIKYIICRKKLSSNIPNNHSRKAAILSGIDERQGLNSKMA
jgi:hypothetical protein